MLEATKTSLLLLFCAFFTLTSCTNKNGKNLSHVTIQTFQTGNGWGYDIKVNEKTYIHQPFIPVIAGEHCFPTEETAMNAGKIVVEKMKKNEIPSLSRQDLRRAGVSL